MKSIKNLTRFTYEASAFQGWRLSLSRKGAAFTKYFSDRKYGDEAKSFAAAEAALAALKSNLEGVKLVDDICPCGPWDSPASNYDRLCVIRL